MSRRSSRRNYSERLGSSQIDEEPEPEPDHAVEQDDEEDDMEEDDEQEITRCICGNDDLNVEGINPVLASLLSSEYQIKIDQGLFIQCDKCSVWQHGYCVGLFINEDVPDKYWCELCKPDLHMVITELNDTFRTLYKPVNDKRKKLMMENEKYINRRKLTRKDRRNYDYDEQLQKALRESAKESGNRNPDDIHDNKSEASSRSTRNSDNDKDIGSDKESKPNNYDDNDVDNDSVTINNTHSEKSIKNTNGDISSNNKNDSSAAFKNDEADVGDEEDEAEGEAEEEEEAGETEIKKDVKRKSLKRARKRDTNKTKPKKAKASTDNGPQISKEELINQPSKPRFVNEKSSIYELRKRISAILEWLNRSQLELEDERTKKSVMTNNSDLINGFDENLVSMQSLTGKILEWEEKYGKYAP